MKRRVLAMGGTKDPDIAAIVAAAPEVVIANREENRREDVEALHDAGIEVLVTDPSTVEEALAMVRQMGKLFDAAERSDELVEATRAEMLPAAEAATRVFVPVWWKPLMALGGDSYGNDILRRAGGVNVLASEARYPEVSMEDAAALRPDLVLLPDEPYRFRESHVAEFASIAPARVVDGKLLWWYGPRMPGALRTLRELLAGTGTEAAKPQREQGSQKD
jgi:ABC-type Fe3+-hydroxamate transport system substrate-binding protein